MAEKVVVCSSAIIDLGLDVMDPGLVPNGAKCGDNRMCVNQKCIKVYSQCENNCYGNGVCKSDSTCVCANGFYPPNCKHSLGSRILLAIYIIFLGILPTVGLIAGGLMYYQEQLKTWWIIKKRKAIIKSRVKRDVHQGSFRARSQQRQNRFAVDFKQVEISQPISLQNGVAVTLCTTSASSSSSPLQHSHHYLPNYSHHSNATSATSNVFVSCDNDSEALRMKPIRPAPPPPPRKPNFDSV